MKKKLFNRFIKTLILTIFTLSSILFIYSVYKLNVFNNLYFSIMSFLIVLFWLLIFLKVNSKKTKKITKIILLIFSIILMNFYSIGYIYLDNTREFFIKASSNLNIEYKTYNVIVLKTSNYKNISDLDKLKISFIDDNNTKNSINKLKNDANITFTDNKFPNVGELIASMQNNESNAVVIDESYYEILEENESEMINNINIIYKYKIAIKKNSKKNKINTNNPFILYLSGTDSREGVKQVARSDVNIVAVINPKSHKILLISIPRDYYVQLHGTTGIKDKLTHAGIYGIDKSINTIEDLLDIDINHYLKVSFSTVIESVDVIGGIDIDSDKNFTAHTNKNCSFIEGTQHVDGACALAFARERYTYTSGDRHRGENQEQVISKMITKLSNPKYLVKYNDILKSIDGSFETSMSYDEITSLVKDELDTLASWEIETYNLDGSGASLPTYSMGSQNLYVMIPYESTIITAKEKIKEFIK